MVPKVGKHSLILVHNYQNQNINYCQREDYGCGTPVPKIIIDVKKQGTLHIIAETNLTSLSQKEDNTIIAKVPRKKPFCIGNCDWVNKKHIWMD